MFIFSNSIRSLHLYKPKICFCNLSGLQEIWVKPRIITKSKNKLLCYLLKTSRPLLPPRCFAPTARLNLTPFTPYALRASVVRAAV